MEQFDEIKILKNALFLCEKALYECYSLMTPNQISETQHLCAAIQQTGYVLNNTPRNNTPRNDSSVETKIIEIKNCVDCPSCLHLSMTCKIIGVEVGKEGIIDDCPLKSLKDIEEQITALVEFRLRDWIANSKKDKSDIYEVIRGNYE